MKQFGELSVEIKSGMAFAVLAFILSIIAGFAGSVPFGMILIRSVIIAPVFFIVGFGILIVIKNYVPEVYGLFQNVKISREQDSESVEIPVENSENENEEIAEKKDTGFSEFTEKDYDRLQSVQDTGIDGGMNQSDGKLGKHIIVENQLNSYEPKLMAQAIRTMMSKDKD